MRLLLTLIFTVTLQGQVARVVLAEDALADRAVSLLASRCANCHGADQQDGNLRLDSLEATLKGGDRGPAVVPGKPRESLLLSAVLHEIEDLAMPPKDRLNAREVATLERWITDGPSWPEKPRSAKPSIEQGEPIGDAWTDPRNPIRKLFDGERLDLWSLKPVNNSAPPQLNSTWPKNSIDQFILDRLCEAGLTPSPEAELRGLIRRVTFDLIGLPPTPERVARFIADDGPTAYDELVDELLASPRYGEHMARTWLDVVRYSDSNGFDWDEFRPQAWRYRDYVIRSLNADKPYDQFVREQLAGDELIELPLQDKADRDRLIATGYLRLGPQDNSAAGFNEQDRARSEWMTDLVDTTASAMLGLTFSCCRCHDHKYDPLSQADYYRMRAFFEPLKFGDDLTLDLAEQQAEIDSHNAELAKRRERLEEERKQIRQATRETLVGERRSALTAEERTLLDGKEPSAEAAERIRELQERVKVTDEQVAAALSGESKVADDKIAAQLAELKMKRRELQKGLLATDSSDPPADTHLLQQGDHRQPGEVVLAGYVSAIDPNPARIARGANRSTHGRRLTLANWIVSAENPLAARVLANRLWQMHFGRGLVETPNDFGLAGAQPLHPELLDWLAGEFIRSGWSIKHMHRLIVTSATYRQAVLSAASTDAQNALYFRQNLRRLTAEQLRDSLLAVSGRLTEQAEGPPVWPELPAEILTANPAFLDDNAEKTKGWYPSPAEQQGARSIFLVQKRGVQIPFLETFDSPSHTVSCPRRVTSTVSPQAFSLLNSSLAVETATSLAERVKQSAGESSADQVDRLYSFALQRAPSESERQRCVAFLSQRSLAELCRVVLNLNEFVYLD